MNASFLFCLILTLASERFVRLLSWAVYGTDLFITLPAALCNIQMKMIIVIIKPILLDLTLFDSRQVSPAIIRLSSVINHQK